MSKAPLFVIVGSGVAIVISLLMIGIGATQIVDIDVESKSIFKGTSGKVTVEGVGIYTIFVNDSFICDETTVTITDGSENYFIAECDRDFDEDGWRAIGVMEPNIDGELSVSSNHEILIIDDIAYADGGGFMMFGGGGLCCIGIIGLVIGIVILSNNKGNSGAQQVIILDQQTMMLHQSHPQPEYPQSPNPPIGPV